MAKVRKILTSSIGTMDFHEMMMLFMDYDGSNLSGGEADAFFRMKQVLARKDYSEIEADMQEVDAFKELLITQFDKVLRDLRMSIAG